MVVTICPNFDHLQVVSVYTNPSVKVRHLVDEIMA